MTTKIERRIKIKYRVRNKISGTAERPRMSVFRSNKQIYVQVIDDLSGKTLAAASSLGMATMPKKEQSLRWLLPTWWVHSPLMQKSWLAPKRLANA